MGLAIRMEESPVHKQARRPRMIQRGTWPKHALLLIDLFIGDAVVIGDAALGGASQLLEYFAGLAEGKVFASAEEAGQIADDLGIPPRVAGRVDRLLNMDHARLHARGDALFFLLKAAGQYDVRMGGGLGEEEIDDTEEFQLLQGFAREVGVRQ